MQVRARGRHLRVSPTKVRRVVGVIRGRGYEEALALLDHLPSPSASLVKKVLASAGANAENNYSLSTDDLFVSGAYVDQGRTRRWFRPRARGRASQIRKRSCHVTLILDEREEE